MKYSVFIATSKDGYIADANGSVEFLDKIDPSLTQEEYWKYYNSIDVLIFGSKTYQAILDFKLEKWPYEDKTCFVLTSKPNNYQPQAGVILFDKGIQELTNKHLDNFEHAWIMGGSKVINDFIDLNLIKEMDIFQTEDLLKDGIKLFKDNEKLNKFKVIKEKEYETISLTKYRAIKN